MRVGSLFSGIAGIDRGLELAGHETVWQSEIDPYALSILIKRYPRAHQLGDITKVREAPAVDLIAGGFPCTGSSQAGKREGMDHADTGLWFEMLRVIEIVYPPFVLIENPSALLYPGRGMDSVVTGLTQLGYFVTWDCIPALAVGAPHIRDRVWIWAAREALWYLPRKIQRKVWPQEPAEPRAVESTAEVRQRLRVLGRAAVPEITRQIGESVKTPIPLPDHKIAGRIRNGVFVQDGGQRSLFATDDAPGGYPRAGYVWGSDVYSVEPAAPVRRAKGRHVAEYPTPSSSSEYGSSGNGEGNNTESTRGRPSLSSMARHDLWPGGRSDARTADGSSRGLWPTPVATDAAAAARHTTGPNKPMHPGTTLTDAVRLWPTPVARDAAAAVGGAGRTPSLGGVLQALNRTETAMEQTDLQEERETRGEEQSDLQELLPTPLAWDGKRPGSTARPDDGKRGASLAEKTGATTAKGLLPNPRFVQWMMDFPGDWFD